MEPGIWDPIEGRELFRVGDETNRATSSSVRRGHRDIAAANWMEASRSWMPIREPALDGDCSRSRRNKSADRPVEGVRRDVRDGLGPSEIPGVTARGRWIWFSGEGSDC